MALKEFFPTLVSIGRLPNKISGPMNREMMRRLEEIRRLDGAGREWSTENYRSGYTSYSSADDLTRRFPVFDQLQERLAKPALEYARALDFEMKGRRLEMTTCWINAMGRGCHHSAHIHPLSHLSGTYFVSVPRGSGSFKIEDPRLVNFMNSPARRDAARERNRRFIEITPEPGMFVLFESWLRHEVPANNSKETRVSISFNYDLV